MLQRKTALLFAGVGVAALAGVAFSNTGQTVPAVSKQRTENRPRPDRASTPLFPEKIVRVKSVSSCRALPPDFPNLFGVPESGVVTPIVAPFPVQKPALATRQRPASAPDPLSNFVCVGIVAVGNTRMALIENKTTHTGEYLRVGDLLAGGRIFRISERDITLQFAEKKRTLPLNSNYSLTPLSQSAPYLQPSAASKPGEQQTRPGATKPATQPAVEEIPNVPSFSPGASPFDLPPLPLPLDQATPETQPENAP